MNSGEQQTSTPSGRAGRDPSKPDHRGLLQSALETVERVQSKLDALQRARSEPIAIIGMSCRFPGGAASPEEYWTVLQERRDVIQEANRWDRAAWARLDPDATARGCRHYAGFVEGIDQFDPGLFGIAPREAVTMDPQQRMLLEVSWEAIERAGYAPDRLAGSPTGVFVGISAAEYAQIVREADPTKLDVYYATGNGSCVAAGRISYLLGLRGPALAVDTACSSSLTAIHLACQSLRLGECDMALAGGVNAILIPDTFICLAKWGAMAPDGRCKAFDASGDGFVRSEGCGMIVLKRLSQALADRDPVLAVIRGSSVNQDGASGGLTVPNGIAQQSVIRQALAAANLRPDEIDYIEAHGTGTSLGDPIELEAIDAVLGEGRPRDQALIVGSVKTNIGHLESAAGVAGLMKVILALQQREIPANLHFRALNPQVTLQRLKVVVPTQALTWTSEGRPRRAGVSSFGFSGTNAHVLLEEASPIENAGDAPDRMMPVLTLSAKSDPALRALVSRYAKHLAAERGTNWGDVCFTSNIGRSHFPHRFTVVASSAKEGLALLGEPNGHEGGGTHRGAVLAGGHPKVAFLFTGQGTQYPEMGRSLREASPVFRDTLERCDEILRGQLDRSLLSVMAREDASRSIDETVYTQPALFAFEYAMSELWKSWGVLPDVVLGHSIGEYVAACVAGVFSLEDALKLVAARGRLMQALPKGGAMAAVLASEEQVHEVLWPYRKQVSIAAWNSPRNVVISGPEASVSQVLASLERQAIETKRLSVSHAFHSPLVEPMLDAFERVAEEVTYSRPGLPLVSNITGDLADPADVATPVYWRRHVRAGVRFADGIRAAAKRAQIFIELGPSPTLIQMGRECLPDSGHVWIPSCRRSQDEARQIADALAMSYTTGVDIDWKSVHNSRQRRRVLLPTYPFEHSRYWVNSSRQRPDQAAIHPFFDVHVVLAEKTNAHVFEGEISLERFPYLRDHRVQGRAVFPATAYSELAMAAKRVAFGQGPVALHEVQYESPILLDESERIRVQVHLESRDEHSIEFTVSSRPAASPDGAEGADWVSNARGALQLTTAPDTAMPAEEFERIRNRCTREIEGVEFYRKLAEKGNQWGASFQGVVKLWRGDREAIALVSAPDAIAGEIEQYEWHPAMADTCGHALLGTISLESTESPRGGAFVGGNIGEARLYAPLRGRRFWTYARLCDDDTESSNVLTGDLCLLDEKLNIVSEVRRASLWYLDHTAATRGAGDWVYSVRFDPARQAPQDRNSAPGKRRWLILADQQGVGAGLRKALEGKGDDVVVSQHRKPSAPITQSRAGDNAIEPEDPGAGLAAIHNVAEGRYDGIVHLWGLDGPVLERADAHDVEAALAVGAESALLCMKGLAACAERQRTPRLWIVTRGAQTVGGADEPADPGQAAIWGLARSFAVENPDLWGGIVDLDPKLAGDDSIALVAEAIRERRGEDQLACRGGRLFAARLSRVRLSPFGHRHDWRPDSTYVITGGLGGLGLKMAEWLVDRGVRHLALIGRTPLPPRESWRSLERSGRDGRRVAAIERIEASGTRVFAGCADVGTEESLAACVDALSRSGWPEIRGVIHAAGVMRYRSLQETTLEDFRESLHAKAIGGWLLHKWSARHKIDCFVLFSSASSILNSPFVGAYAAANGFLDGLAQRRGQQRLPSLGINWGLWSGLGMAEVMSEADRDAAEARGMGSIPADLGLEIFGRLVQQKQHQLSVIPVDWDKWKRLFPAFVGTPFLSELTGAPGNSLHDDGTRRRAQIAAASGSERLGLIRDVVLRHIVGVLGLLPGELDDAVSLSRLGLDSLMATELRSRLEAETGFSLPLVRLLEGPGLGQLVALIEAGLDVPGSSSASDADPSPRTNPSDRTTEAREADRLLERLDGLSDEEVDALLQTMLPEREPAV